MTATAAQIAQIRRMVAEPTSAIYTDTLLKGFIEDHPLMDERGTQAYYWVTSGSVVPTKTENTLWIPTYDLNAAAADVWEEKAASVAVLYDFSADGGDYSRSMMYEQAKNMAKHYKSRSSIKVVTMTPGPSVSTDLTTWIGNQAEPA